MELPDLKTVLTLATGLLAYFGITGAKKKSEATLAAVKRLAKEYVEEVLARLLPELGRTFLEVVTVERVEAEVWKRLAAVGIKKTSARTLAVHELAVVALGKLRRELNAAASKQLPAQVADMAARAKEALSAFEVQPKVLVLDGVTWERIPDDEPTEPKAP